VLLAVDIGTSVFKAALFDAQGNRRALASVPLASSLGAKARHEADCAQWLRAFEICVARLRAGSKVEAIAICGNGPTLAPVLKSRVRSSMDAPFSATLRAAPARLWLDRRAVEAAAIVSREAGAFVDASFALPKALDIKMREPALYEKTEVFLGCPELLACALSGEARTVFPADGLERWFWDDALLERLGLDREKFPPFIRPGEIFGPLSARAAFGLGFQAGIPVISGGSDFIAAIVGSGATVPGAACNRCGTSDGVNVCAREPATDGRLMSYRHPAKPFFNVSGIISTTGKAIEWALALVGARNYAEFFALAKSARPGSGGTVFLPYLSGERAPVWKALARGALRGLGLETGRAEIARATIEGINFAARDIIETIAESGALARELRVCGAQARDDFFCQIKADVTGKAVISPAQSETELLGLAAIASRALGRHEDFARAAKAFAKPGKIFRPAKKCAALYDDLFSKYRAMRDAAWE